MVVSYSIILQRWCETLKTMLKYAVLIPHIPWEYEKTEFILDQNITIINLEESKVEGLYHNLCKETGLDDGDPYSYHSALLIEDVENNYSISPSSKPWSLSSLFMNLLTILNSSTFDHCKVIASKDDFDSCWRTYELYDPLVDEMHELNNTHNPLNEQTLFLLKGIWNNLKLANSKRNSRIDNALNFFFYSWHVHSIEQTAISLSIVLESLFSPDSNTELSHQIAFNIAKFSELEKEDRLKIYRLIKKYYSIRSKLVHGETITFEEFESIPIFFKLICSLLLKILKNPELILVFNDNNSRKNYLRDRLFE
jgi:Apea-like HEPN